MRKYVYEIREKDGSLKIKRIRMEQKSVSQYKQT